MLQTELARLLQSQQPLNANPLAKDLYRMLDRENFVVIGDPNEEKDVINWIGRILSLSLIQDKVPSIPFQGNTVDEYLFKSISIKGIKKIPRSDTYMRLNLSNNEIPVSTIIMGENGVGKSSFYGAMEYIGMGEMNTARIYNQQKEEYIRNIFSITPDVSAVLKTTHSDLSLNIAAPKSNCFPSFYISEWDIHELGKMPDFGPYIFSQLGVQDFNLLLSLLIAARDKLSESIVSRNALRDTIQRGSIEIEALKLIIAYKGIKTTEEIKNLVDDKVYELPKVLANNRLVNNTEELISHFEEEINTDLAYHHYRNACNVVSDSYVTAAIEDLKKVVFQHRKTPFWGSKDNIKYKIDQCKRRINDFNAFKRSLRDEISYLLDTYTDPLPNLIEYSFNQMTILSKHIQEWQNNLEYNIMKDADDLDKTMCYLEETIGVLETRFNELVSKWKDEIIQPILRSLLAEYLKDENETVEILYNENQRSMSAGLVVTKANDLGTETTARINPRAYFNTFRFKMFAISLKVALACCAKSIYNVNWPIVIDDVFNSTDFSNRSRMGDYIERICKTYDKLDKVKDMRFQLIFFTQDDVIGDAVFGGLKAMKKNAILLRLHDYRCFNKNDNNQSDGDILHIDVGMVVNACNFD